MATGISMFVSDRRSLLIAHGLRLTNDSLQQEGDHDICNRLRLRMRPQVEQTAASKPRTGALCCAGAAHPEDTFPFECDKPPALLLGWVANGCAENVAGHRRLANLFNWSGLICRISRRPAVSPANQSESDTQKSAHIQVLIVHSPSFFSKIFLLYNKHL